MHLLKNEFSCFFFSSGLFLSCNENGSKNDETFGDIFILIIKPCLTLSHFSSDAHFSVSSYHLQLVSDLPLWLDHAQSFFTKIFCNIQWHCMPPFVCFLF